MAEHIFPRVVRWRKRPVVVEAVYLCRDSEAAVLAWVCANGGRARAEGEGIIIRTLEGEMAAGMGDFVVRGVAGEFYPCRGDIFERTHEPVDDGAAMAAHETRIDTSAILGGLEMLPERARKMRMEIAGLGRVDVVADVAPEGSPMVGLPMEKNVGWACPVCGVGNAPWSATCGRCGGGVRKDL